LGSFQSRNATTDSAEEAKKEFVRIESTLSGGIHPSDVGFAGRLHHFLQGESKSNHDAGTSQIAVQRPDRLCGSDSPEMIDE
jgi:hypothetical protein